MTTPVRVLVVAVARTRRFWMRVHPRAAVRTLEVTSVSFERFPTSLFLGTTSRTEFDPVGDALKQYLGPCKESSCYARSGDAFPQRA